MGYVVTALVSGMVGAAFGVCMVAMCQAAHECDESMPKPKKRTEQNEE